MDIQIPDSIKRRISNSSFTINEENALVFIKFTLPEEIDFFKSLDWILDYNEIQNLSEEEIEISIKKLLENVKPIDDNKPYEIKTTNSKEKLRNFEILRHKVNSLALMLEIKQGKKPIILPSNVMTKNSCKIVYPEKESNKVRKKVIIKN